MRFPCFAIRAKNPSGFDDGQATGMPSPHPGHEPDLAATGTETTDGRPGFAAIPAQFPHKAWIRECTPPRPAPWHCQSKNYRHRETLRPPESAGTRFVEGKVPSSLHSQVRLYPDIRAQFCTFSGERRWHLPVSPLQLVSGPGLQTSRFSEAPAIEVGCILKGPGNPHPCLSGSFDPIAVPDSLSLLRSSRISRMI